MKKKIYKFVSVAVIAVAMVVSFQISKANNTTTLTMENVEALAMADGEGSIGHMCALVCENCWCYYPADDFWLDGRAYY